MVTGNVALAERRSSDREQVHHRARAIGADGRTLQTLVVDLSPTGLMTRCDAAVAIGEKIRVQLPIVGQTRGEVRWALGGRFGLQFDVPVDLARFPALLNALR